MIISSDFKVKVNANIGNSAVTSWIVEEVEKLRWATLWVRRHGHKNISTGKDIHETRKMIMQNAPVRSDRADLPALEKVAAGPES